MFNMWLAPMVERQSGFRNVVCLYLDYPLPDIKELSGQIKEMKNKTIYLYSITGSPMENSFVNMLGDELEKEVMKRLYYGFVPVRQERLRSLFFSIQALHNYKKARRTPS